MIPTLFLLTSYGKRFAGECKDGTFYENARASIFPVACCGVIAIKWYKYLTFRRFPVPL
jgi:hypothetical protein